MPNTNAIADRNIDASPLAKSKLTVTITDLVAEYELVHTFENKTEKPMEAIYSFPIPLDAAFMGMEAELAGEKHVAQIQLRSEAQEQYDDAVCEGDSAVLLERVEPGMLCVNLGNLMPDEEGKIVLTFATLLRCSGGQARFSLPLVHRPRYGRSYLEDFVEPGHDFAIEHPLEAAIYVQGLLAAAPVNCATHSAKFTSKAGEKKLCLNQVMLDRDLVLTFDLPDHFSGQARQVYDGENSIGMLSFNVPAQKEIKAPTDLCLVMDCSGSMTGDAIEQSRAALRAVSGALGREDRIQVLRFGTEVSALFRRPLKATSRVKNALVELSSAIDSNLGGTEIESALSQTISTLSKTERDEKRPQAIILVTDGAVQPQAIQKAQDLACEKQIAIFVVAVGSSAGADVLEPLANATGGVLERAVPAEPIDRAVMRQFRRLRSGKPVSIDVDWGADVNRAIPFGHAFPGDSVTCFALLKDSPAINPTVHIADESYAKDFQVLGIEYSPAIRALAGHQAYQHAQEQQRPALALEYGLVTDETSAVLVKERAEGEKSDELPKIKAVDHMYPHGAVLSRPNIRFSLAPEEPSYMGDYIADGESGQSLRDNRNILAEIMPFSIAEVQDFNQSEPSTLESQLSSEAIDGLISGLFTLLFGEKTKQVTLKRLLNTLDSSLRTEAKAYIAKECPGKFDNEQALELLWTLLEENPEIYLSEEQEIQLALLKVRDCP